jgi:hypothetical protein
MAEVIEIQVCGGKICADLKSACEEYLRCIENDVDREKIHFSVSLRNDVVKHITFRKTDDGIVVYGDFEGLPNFVEWAKEKV